MVDRKLISVDISHQNRYFRDEVYSKTDNHDLFDPREKYDEEDFLDRCVSNEKVISTGEVDCWIAEFNSRYEDLEQVRDLKAEQLFPAYETMLSVFEDQIDAAVEGANLTMKEIQGFYKIRTKILHSKINELNQLV